MLRDALAAADVAAVLLRLKPAGERDLINRIKTLAPVVQQKDTALVLDGQAEIAARAGADGAHLTGIEAFMAAVDSLKPARIAGCGGLNSRDDAMLAGERGADYVMFGETDASGRHAHRSRRSSNASNGGRSCSRFPASDLPRPAREVGPLVAAGADFVAVGDGIWDDPRGAAAALAEAARQLGAPETTA